MPEITYEVLEQRLTQEARALYCEMVEAHLATTGDRFFIRSDTFGGAGMHFVGGGGTQRTWRGFDGGAIEDLAGYGLIHVSYTAKGTPNYRISGEGLAFFRWLQGSRGAAITQVEETVQRFVAGDAVARAHPGGAHHLREAFDLVWSDNPTGQVVSEIGDHLRKSLMDVTTGIVGSTTQGGQEKPVERLKEWIAGRGPQSTFGEDDGGLR